MKTLHRACNEQLGDYKRMWNLLVNDYADKQEHFIWSLGRIGEWKYALWDNTRLFPNFIENNAHIWLDNNEEILGFVISENCDKYFHPIVRRGYEFLYREIIEWTLANWNDREGSFSTEVGDSQNKLMAVLDDIGFVQEMDVAITHQYDINKMNILQPSLPEGYLLKDMFSHPNDIARLGEPGDVWDQKAEEQDFRMRQYIYQRENPAYFPHLDIYIENPEGIIGAGCLAFPDYKNNYAEIEKVGTHKNFWRQGLAQAVIYECMRRLRDDGIAYAYITGSSEEAKNLYGKIEHSKSHKWHRYSLEKN